MFEFPVGARVFGFRAEHWKGNAKQYAAVVADCIANNCLPMGWGNEYDLTDWTDDLKQELAQELTPQGFAIVDKYRSLEVGDFVVCAQGKFAINGVGRVTVPYECNAKDLAKLRSLSDRDSYWWNGVTRVEWIPNSAGFLKRDWPGTKWANATFFGPFSEDQLRFIEQRIGHPTGTIFSKDGPVGVRGEPDAGSRTALDLDNIRVAKVQDCDWRWRRAHTRQEVAWLKRHSKVKYVRETGDMHEGRNFDPSASEGGLKYQFFQRNSSGGYQRYFETPSGIMFWLSTKQEIVGLSAWCEMAPEDDEWFSPKFDDGKDRQRAGLKGKWEFNVRCPDDEECWCEFAVPVVVGGQRTKDIFGKGMRQATIIRLDDRSKAEQLLREAERLQKEAVEGVQLDEEGKLRASRSLKTIAAVLREFDGGTEMPNRDERALGSSVKAILEQSRTRAVLLFGPAGTGKTREARRLAETYREQGGMVQTLQFHPAYAYEDFMEGLRPERGNDGKISYEVRDGVFKEFCEKARDDPEQNHLFIIDEINRGNVPKVMGELMYALEYRDKPLNLPYSGTEFVIPDNVHILGTMNSSDRSVAMLDVALRRRFHFVELPPKPDLAARVVLKRENLNLGHLLASLNRTILKDKGRHFLLGHSYFLPADFDEIEGGELTLEELKRRWFHQILPLLEEYFADDVKALRGVIGDAWDTPGTERGDYFVPVGPDMDSTKFVDALRQLTKLDKPADSSATAQT